MGLLDLLLVAVGLSMDAFAVSVCKGLNTKMHPVKTGLVAGLYFGGFQALMPTLGYICGGTIRQYIEAVSKYVALFLLCIIGINMIRENLKGECKETNGALGFTVMVPAAIATSIDAFAVGITLSALNVKIMLSVISRPEALAFLFAFFFNMPCLMALTATTQETHSMKWTVRIALYYVLTALIMATIAYHVGLVIF